MEKYKVDFAKLDKERPIGVSGLMRVKNDGEFVAASIESCIEALDELIIVYDDSEDNTEEVIKLKQKKYSDKIKVYHYGPQISSHNLSDSEIDTLMELPEDSPHLLATYYNWTMAKVTYRYAFKIDADQIYFSEKLKMICDLYRSQETQKVFVSEKIIYSYFEFLNRLFFHLSPKTYPLFSHLLFGDYMAKRVQSYIFKRICNDKIISSFSGLNIFVDEKIMIPLGRFCDGIQPPTNGSGDHIFFKPSSQNRYVAWPQKMYHRIIEIMKPSNKMYFGGGFLWLHLNPNRKSVIKTNRISYKGHTICYDNFINCNFFDLYLKYNLTASYEMKFYIYQSLLADKSVIEKNIIKYQDLLLQIKA